MKKDALMFQISGEWSKSKSQYKSDKPSIFYFNQGKKRNVPEPIGYSPFNNLKILKEDSKEESKEDLREEVTHDLIEEKVIFVRNSKTLKSMSMPLIVCNYPAIRDKTDLEDFDFKEIMKYYNYKFKDIKEIIDDLSRMINSVLKRINERESSGIRFYINCHGVSRNGEPTNMIADKIYYNDEYSSVGMWFRADEIAKMINKSFSGLPKDNLEIRMLTCKGVKFSKKLVEILTGNGFSNLFVVYYKDILRSGMVHIDDYYFISLVVSYVRKYKIVNIISTYFLWCRTCVSIR